MLQIKSKWNKNTKWRDNLFLYKSIRMEIKSILKVSRREGKGGGESLIVESTVVFIILQLVQ